MSVTIDGSAGVTTNTGAVYNGLQTATAQASTSGTAILFTSIPLWVKRITVMFSAVSTNGTSYILFQLGSGSVTTTGYTATSSSFGAGVNTTNSTAGFILRDSANATDSRYGTYVFTTMGSNIWTGTGLSTGATTATSLIVGGVTLSGTLDRVNITTVAGTDTFDAGTINLIYE